MNPKPIAVIPVAGVGSRLRPHTHTVPKSLINVAGKPMLAHILDELEKISAEERLKRRYDKFRSHGHYVEKKTAAAA